MSVADLVPLTDRNGRTFDFKLIHCPICGPTSQTEVGWRGGEFHRYRMGVPTRIVQCDECELLFPNPMPVPRNVGELYGDPDKYFEHEDRAERVERCRELLRTAQRLIGGSDCSVLDVGCGRGELLEAAHTLGLEAVGLDLSPAMASETERLTRQQVRIETIESHAEGPNRYDVIVLQGVLEHVADPKSMMMAAAQLSHPGSVVYIDCPNEPNLFTAAANAWSRLRRNRAVYNLSPTFEPCHVMGFGETALIKILAASSFTLLERHVWASAKVRSDGTASDRLKAVAGTQINRFANAIGRAHNQSLWAQRVATPVAIGQESLKRSA